MVEDRLDSKLLDNVDVVEVGTVDVDCLDERQQTLMTSFIL